jgi:superfamily II DNA or RNA helicase
MSYKTKEKYIKGLLKEQSEKTLIFANTKEQADNLCNNSYHSTNKDSKDNLEDFIKNKINKLSAVEQLSEGINIPGLKTIIIMHAYGNNRKATQKIGRALRLNPNDKATIHILCYENTADEHWVKDALKAFNKDKITWKKGKAYAELYV